MTQLPRHLNADTTARRLPPHMDTTLLPPPGIHPNNAVFNAVNLPKPLTWQRREHMTLRRNILSCIGQLLLRNAQLVANNANGAAAAGGSNMNSPDVNNAAMTTWALARKLEVLMFMNAASLLEYNNIHSLTRRVQALTSSIVNKKIRRQIQSSDGAGLLPPQTCGSSYPRMGEDSPLTQQMPPVAASPSPSSSPTDSQSVPIIGYLIHKRTADEMQISSEMNAMHMQQQQQLEPQAKRPRRFVELGALLFREGDEMANLVWSYVSGVDIMRCRAVNRAADAIAPLLVNSLQLSCNAVQIALTTPGTGSASILRKCVHLKHLEIESLSAGMTFGKLSMRANNCPQRFVVTHDDHERIVLYMAEQLRTNAFPKLTRLGLTCLFTNEEADGEADVLLNNLMLGCCPQLEELCLPGNSFGDYGAAKVTQMLRSQVCPKLTRLDLRRNFIGEDGIRRLCHALADGCAPNLMELCLGGNTITDSCFHHILYAMESGKLRNLRFLGIEMNYLTASSMEMLGRTIGKLVCPVLSQISYSDNSVDNATAKRIIAVTVYQERMRRAQGLQQIRDGHVVEDEDWHTSSDDDEDEEEDEMYSSDGE